MEYLMSHFWLILPVLSLIVFLVIWKMKRISADFVTLPPKSKSFSIFSLQFAGSDTALSQLVEKMDVPVRAQVRKYLRLDFLLMFALYPLIALLCYRVALHIRDDAVIGYYILSILACLQGLAWIFNIVDNLVLFQKLKNPIQGSAIRYNIYQSMVFLKFLIAFTGIDSVLLVMVYVWLAGYASVKLTVGITILFFLVLLFVIIKSWLKNRKRKKMEELELQQISIKTT